MTFNMRAFKTRFVCTSIQYSSKGRSFASAFAISVIASEELGKAFGIAEIIFQAGFELRIRSS